MWRMFRAAIMGVLLGVVGGIIVGHVSYVNNYADSPTDKIASHAVMYSIGGASGKVNSSEITADSGDSDICESDTDGIIRLQVRYQGDAVDEDDREALTNYVGNCVMEQFSYEASQDSYADVWNDLVNTLNDINKYACEAGEEWGASLVAASRMSYEYFDEDGEYPAGYYNSLCITLADK